jgi:hypothetical protein
LCVFAAVIVASFMRPTLWLVALPGLIPVLGLASWTGSMLVDETDLLALALAAGGYARWAWHRYAVRGARHIAEAANGESLRIPLVATVLVLLFASSVAVSLGRGIADAGGLRWDWYPGYFDALNSVRIGKSFALALALAPLLIRALQQDARHAAALLGAGFALGTAIAALTVVWERAAFTGLLDFSTDYRATGMFWEMHVGGAALDGWLALGMPFVVWMLDRYPRSPLRVGRLPAACRKLRVPRDVLAGRVPRNSALSRHPACSPPFGAHRRSPRDGSHGRRRARWRSLQQRSRVISSSAKAGTGRFSPSLACWPFCSDCRRSYAGRRSANGSSLPQWRRCSRSLARLRHRLSRRGRMSFTRQRSLRMPQC